MATYLKIDLTMPQHRALLNMIKAQFLARRAGNAFSVNENQAGTMAWVKTVKMPQMNKGTSHMILDVAVGYGEDVNKVAKEVNSMEWVDAEDASGNEGE